MEGISWPPAGQLYVESKETRGADQMAQTNT